jgi:hypothetical protein
LPAVTRSPAPIVEAAVPSGHRRVSSRGSYPADAAEAHDVPNAMQEGLIQTHPGYLTQGSPLTYSLTVRLPVAKTDSVGYPAAGR